MPIRGAGRGPAVRAGVPDCFRCAARGQSTPVPGFQVAAGEIPVFAAVLPTSHRRFLSSPSARSRSKGPSHCRDVRDLPPLEARRALVPSLDRLELAGWALGFGSRLVLGGSAGRLWILVRTRRGCWGCGCWLSRRVDWRLSLARWRGRRVRCDRCTRLRRDRVVRRGRRAGLGRGVAHGD